MRASHTRTHSRTHTAAADFFHPSSSAPAEALLGDRCHHHPPPKEKEEAASRSRPRAETLAQQATARSLRRRDQALVVGFISPTFVKIGLPFFSCIIM